MPNPLHKEPFAFNEEYHTPVADTKSQLSFSAQKRHHIVVPSCRILRIGLRLLTNSIAVAPRKTQQLLGGIWLEMT